MSHTHHKAHQLRNSGDTETQYPGDTIPNWREAGDLYPGMEAAIESHQRTGRPWGDDAFVGRLEQRTGRRLKRQKPGRKPRVEQN